MIVQPRARAPSRAIRPARWLTVHRARGAYVGPLTTLGVITVLHLFTHRVVPIANPGAALLVAVVASAFLGGVRPGLISAGIILVYAVVVPAGIATPYSALPQPAVVRFAVLAVTAPAAALIVGLLKERSERQLAELGRVAAQLREANARLERLSLVDSLTGIANRRRWDELLDEAWAEARRTGLPLAVLLLDVDCFKSYNDRYGHIAGDAALVTLARLLSRGLWRPADAVARYGGEEFAIILPDADATTAAEVAERLRLAVVTRRIAHRGSVAHDWLTISVGVATCVPRETNDAWELVRAADAALYQAKRAGRNRVAVAAAGGHVDAHAA